jgi:hypothetical protein
MNIKIKSKTKIFVALLLTLVCGTSIALQISLDFNKFVDIILNILSVFSGAVATYSFTNSFTINKSNNDSKKIEIKDHSHTGDIVTIQGQTVYVNQENAKILEIMEKIAVTSEKLSQENLTKIMIKVKEELSKETLQVNEPSKDFLFKYIEEAKKISSEEIQQIWSELFVQETKNPNSITVRTLDIIKNMSVSEANTFTSIAKYAVIFGDSAYIPKDISSHISIRDLTNMADIGLIKGDLNLTWIPKVNGNSTFSILNNKLVLIIHNNSQGVVELKIPARVFTDSGFQLLKSLRINASDQLFISFAEEMRRKNKNVAVTCHQLIESYSNGTFRYQTQDLLPPS